ncbi:MAG TPA: acyl-CoA dehydrogenase family protein [Thermoanaerobaculia bacterium]|jgi:alkylation response protein AidB-like acyl-CoA dehydrogenase|nr:acyl-CoA dehydrogenase family protein [Thermoanaerobaculia bacterium]
MAAKEHVSEQESRQVAEASRETEWKQPSFMREMFLGNFRLDLVDPYPLPEPERPEFTAFFDALKRFVRDEVDSVEIDATGEYPERVLDGLRKLGAFGMKIPKQYGGLGFTNVEYQQVMQLFGSLDGNLSALLSAHQSIGVPQPLKLFGSEELKQKYLPRCARGEISAFALTEPEVGSDPARLETSAVKTPAGDAYVLNGHKLWCTNGTIAKLLVVMARDPQTKQISAFVVEADWPGVKIEHRCHFMGLHALANAVISFTNVRVPAENLIGKAGRGLKIALTTLNDGRLSIPNGSVGTVKVCLEICRKWANERVQWGRPIGKHEAVSHKLADMAAIGFAMESIAHLATVMADSGNYDIRLEAAACKEWNTDRTWEIVDDTMQIRGGRGYETERSLAARGEKPIGVERLMRDYRINKIFEGSSEIMHLFMAREAVDKHLQVAGSLIDPDKALADKLAALPQIAAFYGAWYPSRWLGWGQWPRYSEYGPMATHLRFVERNTRRLSRQIFHGMIVYQGALQNKQAFLFRIVDIANEMFAMTAAAARAHAMAAAGAPHAAEAIELADLFCRGARRKVMRLLRDLWANDDARKYRVALRILEGRHAWMEADIEGMMRRGPAPAVGGGAGDHEEEEVPAAAVAAAKAVPAPAAAPPGLPVPAPAAPSRPRPVPAH